MNAKFTISYDGTCFKGSQRQEEKGTVEDKLIEIFSLLNIEAKITLSGRTDKNVHASGQVFNMILPPYFSNLKKLKRILNEMLPLEIRVHKIQEVEKDFHSRFHARKRVYRYFITTSTQTPFTAKYIHHTKELRVDLIQDAIKLFIGVHDFEYFHKKGSDKENLQREIYEARFYKHKDIFVFSFKANSYLRSQIRLMVGFLLEISEQKLSKSDLKAQLEKKKKVFNKPCSAYGLYLAKVLY